VLALMPLPGDVDVVLASELMEAGRAVQRGLVTPDRTTLIASTHRVYAIAEKTAMGDGRADSAALLAQVRAAARRFVGHDMAQAADEAGSVISAVIFGTLAGTGVLPFTRAQFEATIERGGVGVKPSLKAFGTAFERAERAERAERGERGELAELAGRGDSPAPMGESATPPFTLPRSAHPAVQALLDRAAKEHAGDTLPLVVEGLRRLVDYQDPDYAALYLQRLATVQAAQRGADPDSGLLTRELARHLALWMSYEDTLRVADLKTRDTRFARVRDEVRAQPGQQLEFSEFMHPRLQEIADTLPAGLGRWLLASGAPRRWLERLAAQGRVVRTSTVSGFLLLWAVAGLKRWRRGTLRFGVEQQRIEAWLADIHDQLQRGRLAEAIEVTRCQRLVKGYGDTHERGLRHFELLRGAWRQGVAAATLSTLRDAALADDHGHALRAALGAALKEAAALKVEPGDGTDQVPSQVPSQTHGTPHPPVSAPV